MCNGSTGFAIGEIHVIRCHCHVTTILDVFAACCLGLQAPGPHQPCGGSECKSRGSGRRSDQELHHCVATPSQDAHVHVRGLIM